MFREKKFYIMGVVTILNYLCEYLQKSGAFEIYFNGIQSSFHVTCR